ncbi:hypothetical protein [Niabella hibiscisoli]|uniref:hypothetical protein n=1 Tax=Niabella hibiscisoli TaxID=1825928 RepID=UPI001F0F73AA|nr:hypothetical protein [Niabella hibiscisoli]MCH5716793.1 hypothetical protein [Niabella hibiscisoli]
MLFKNKLLLSFLSVATSYCFAQEPVANNVHLGFVTPVSTQESMPAISAPPLPYTLYKVSITTIKVRPLPGFALNYTAAIRVF